MIYDKFTYLYLLEYVYRQSIVSVKDYYKTCVTIAYKTSNSQSEIDAMPYYQFNNFVVFLNEIIEEENKGSENGEGENTPKNMLSSTTKSFSDSMKSARQSFGSFKLK